jgi:hypothetical protein
MLLFNKYNLTKFSVQCNKNIMLTKNSQYNKIIKKIINTTQTLGNPPLHVETRRREKEMRYEGS